MPIGPIIAGVCLLVGLVAVFLSRPVWRVPTLLAMAALLLINGAFIYLAAGALLAHQNWRSEVKAYEAETAKRVEATKILAEGKEGDSEAMQKSVTNLKQELYRLMYGRGRVWVTPNRATPLAGPVFRAPALAEAQVGKISIEFPVDVPQTTLPTLPATPPTTPPAPTQPAPLPIVPKTSLYVFENKDYNPTAVDGGGKFIGEFEVTAVNGRVVQMELPYAVTADELKKIGSIPNGAPLVVYEIMPVDEHELVLSLTEDTRRRLFPKAILGDTVAEWYISDQKPVPEDAPAGPNIWPRVKFLKPYETTDPRTKAKVTMAVGAEAVIDPQTAEALVANATVAPVKDSADKPVRIFVRPLNDYVVRYREHFRRINAAVRDKAALDKKTATLVAAKEQADKDEDKQKQDRDGLKYDLEQIVVETAIIDKFIESATTQVAAMKKEVEELTAANAKAAAELNRGASSTGDAAKSATARAEPSRK